MIETMLKAIAGITVIVGGWLTVQLAWRRVFGKSLDRKDTVVGRCDGYGCCRSTCDAADDKAGSPASAPQFNYKD